MFKCRMYYLGYVVSEDGIEAIQAKHEADWNWPELRFCRVLSPVLMDS